MELLEPLAVDEIALAARDAPHMASVHEDPLEAPLLEDLVERDPVDAGGLHGDRLDSAGGEPVGELMQVGGEGAEASHGLRIAVGGDGDPVHLRSHVDARCVRVDRVEALSRTCARPLLQAAAPLRRLALHERLLQAEGKERPRPGMRRGCILLNGITQKRVTNGVLEASRGGPPNPRGPTPTHPCPTLYFL